MSNRPDRGWMYKRIDGQGYLSEEYCHNLDGFLDFAFSSVVGGCVERKIVGHEIVLRIKCPCVKCKNIHYTARDDVRLHLMRHGFMQDYTTWWAHGEKNVPFQHVGQCSNAMEDDNVDGCIQMVNDNNPTMHMHSNLEEEVPNPSAQGFYDMLQDADEPLWDGCQKFSKLQAATRLLNWKSDCNVSESTFNQLLLIIKDMLPDGHRLVSNFYETKKMLKKLGFPKEKIDACKNHCMLFYKGDSSLTNCRVCGEYRYKNSGQNKVPNLVLTYMPIAPRLQRLFMSRKTAKEMTWHYDHQTESGSMVHPSDGEAWKHFDLKDPRFAEEIRNGRLGLCVAPPSAHSTRKTLPSR